MSKRDEYVGQLKAQLDQWNTEIAKWEARTKEVEAGARAEYEKRLVAVREQRDKSLEQLRQLQSAAGDAWLELMKGTEEAWGRMREAFDKASSHFRPK
jgi:hypothetical protein